MRSYILVSLLLIHFATGCDEFETRKSCTLRKSCEEYEYPSGRGCRIRDPSASSYYSYEDVTECCDVKKIMKGDGSFIALWVISAVSFLIVLVLGCYILYPICPFCRKHEDERNFIELNRIYNTLFKRFKDDIKANMVGNIFDGQWKSKQGNITVKGDVATVGDGSATIGVGDDFKDFTLPGGYTLSTAIDVRNKSSIAWSKKISSNTQAGILEFIRWVRVDSESGIEMETLDEEM